jgi:hypothetical protein
VWPSEYTTPDKAQHLYGDNLAPFIQKDCHDENVGKSTEPLRFSELDLEERRLSYGRSGYALQFMLNPRLSDVDRYPLKINDLVVMDIDNEVGPEKIV